MILEIFLLLFSVSSVLSVVKTLVGQ